MNLESHQNFIRKKHGTRFVRYIRACKEQYDLTEREKIGENLVGSEWIFGYGVSSAKKHLNKMKKW